MSILDSRVAALYDIHGNLPALEAVLEQGRYAVVDCTEQHRAAMVNGIPARKEPTR